MPAELPCAKEGPARVSPAPVTGCEAIDPTSEEVAMVTVGLFVPAKAKPGG